MCEIGVCKKHFVWAKAHNTKPREMGRASALLKFNVLTHSNTFLIPFKVKNYVAPKFSTGGDEGLNNLRYIPTHSSSSHLPQYNLSLP